MMYSMYNVGGDNDQIMAGISNGLDDGLVLTESRYYGGANTEWLERSGGISLANVFEEEGVLGAVGTYTYDSFEEVTVEGESQEVYLDNSYVRFEASSEPGESYIMIGGEWIDLTDEDIQNLLSISFIPNNACIKALFI